MRLLIISTLLLAMGLSSCGKKQEKKTFAITDPLTAKECDASVAKTYTDIQKNCDLTKLKEVADKKACLAKVDKMLKVDPKISCLSGKEEVTAKNLSDMKAKLEASIIGTERVCGTLSYTKPAEGATTGGKDDIKFEKDKKEYSLTSKVNAVLDQFKVIQNSKENVEKEVCVEYLKPVQGVEGLVMEITALEDQKASEETK